MDLRNGNRAVVLLIDNYDSFTFNIVHPPAAVRPMMQNTTCFSEDSPADANTNDPAARETNERYWTRTSDLFHVKEAR